MWIEAEDGELINTANVIFIGNYNDEIFIRTSNGDSITYYEGEDAEKKFVKLKKELQGGN